MGPQFGLQRGWYGRKEREGVRIAGIRTFALGAASVLGRMPPAVAVIAVLLLAMKSLLHGCVARIEKCELTVLFQLAVLSILILPLLNRTVGMRPAKC